MVASLAPTIRETRPTGRNAIGLAGLTGPPGWQMKRDLLSNRGTPRWAELATIHAN